MKKSGLILILMVISVFMVSSVLAVNLRLYPNANGAYSQWTNYKCSSSAEWACVDEDPFNLTDYVYTGTNNYKESFNFTDTGLTNQTIFSVDLYYYAKQYSSTKYYIRPLLWQNGANYFGNNFYLYSSYGYRSQSFKTNPFTGNPWTVSELDNLQAGMIANGTTSAYTGAYVAQVYADVDYDDPDLYPDLVPTNLNVYKYNAGSNLTNETQIMASVSFSVNNTGDDTSGESVASIVALGTKIQNISILRVGQLASVYSGYYNCTESHNATLIVDLYNNIEEINEDNNQQTIFVDCIL